MVRVFGVEWRAGILKEASRGVYVVGLLDRASFLSVQGDMVALLQSVDTLKWDF